MQEDEFLLCKAQQKHYNVGDFVLSSIVVACVQTTPHPLPSGKFSDFSWGEGGCAQTELW